MQRCTYRWTARHNLDPCRITISIKKLCTLHADQFMHRCIYRWAVLRNLDRRRIAGPASPRAVRSRRVYLLNLSAPPKAGRFHPVMPILRVCLYPRRDYGCTAPRGVVLGLRLVWGERGGKTVSPCAPRFVPGVLLNTQSLMGLAALCVSAPALTRLRRHAV